MINKLEIRELKEAIVFSLRVQVLDHADDKKLIVKCPVCTSNITAFKWSIAGSGKLCPRCKDNVLLTTNAAAVRFKDKDSAIKRAEELKTSGNLAFDFIEYNKIDGTIEIID